MNGVRVLIIDDVESEILDLVRGLWRIGAAPLYIDPAVLEHEDNYKPLSGIRLAFLDMDIVGAGADAKSKVAALANCIRRVISKDNGPYVAVAFTKHRELVGDLDDYIFPNTEIARPYAFVTIGKEECKDVPALSARIDEELRKRGAMRMLQRWEESSTAASGEVVGELAAIASGSESEPGKWREAWGKAMLRIMHSCGRESVGDSGMSTGATAFKAFCLSIIPLHADKLESRVAVPCPDLEEASRELLAVDSKADCGIEAKARINAMLHCSFDDLSAPRPGNVYSLKSPGLTPLFPDVAAMIEGLVPRGQKTAEEFRIQVQELAAQVLPIAVETSPACDHVQGNLIVARLTGGCLVPVDVAKKMFKSKLPESIWDIAPLWIPGQGGDKSAYVLFVNCLLVSSCALEVLEKEVAVFRIRSQAFATLQVCFGSHAARPGMLLLR
ncbi:MAG: hypothetical protein ACLQIS_18010 [Bryobacteraceae bacterium]